MRKLISLLILLTLVTSCSRKEVNVRDHIDNSIDQVETAADQQEISNVIYQNRVDLYKIIESKNEASATSNLDKFFQNYIDVVFFSENNLPSEVKATITDIMNQLIMLSSKYENYKSALLEVVYKGCGSNMSSCVKYSLYPKVKSSLQLMIQDIRVGQFGSQDAARLLHILQENRGTPDPEIFLLIMENQDSLNDYLSSHGSLENAGSSIVDLAIRQVKTKSDSNPEFKARYCDSALEINALTSLESPLKTFSQKEKILEIMLYCRSALGSIKDLFASKVDEDLKSESESFLKSYSLMLPEFYQRFEVEENLVSFATKEGALELFVVDRLFHEKLSTSVAVDIIKHFGNLSDLRVLELLDMYTKSYFAFRAEQTFNSFFSAFKDSVIENEGLSSSILVDVMQNVSRVNYEQWAKTVDRYGFIGDLLNQLFGSKVQSGMGDKSRDIYFSLIRKISKNSFIETVKQNVEQPMQLVLSYFLSLLKGDVKFYIPWSSNIDKYVSFDASDSLRNFTNPAGQIQSSYSFFQFLGVPGLRLTPVKVKSSFYKASKMGLFEKIPFEVESLKKDEEPDYLANTKLLLNNLFEYNLEDSILARQNTELLELKRKYLARDRDGMKSIKAYCSNPFDSFFESSFSIVNSRVSFYSSTSTSDSRPLVFTALSDASSVTYWSDWVKKKEQLSSFVDMLALSKPNLAQEIIKFSKDELKRYEKPLIEISAIKKELKDEIFGTGCLKKAVMIEQFRTRFVYKEFDSFFKKVHLTSTLYKSLKNKSTLTLQDIENSLKNISTTGVEFEVSIISKQVSSLFSEEKVKVFFGVDAEGNVSQSNFKKFLTYSLSGHNRDDLGSLIGYQVDGAPTYETTNNFDLPNYIEFIGDRFVISRWDLYLRARHVMLNSYYQGENSELWPEDGPIFTQLLFDIGGQTDIERKASELNNYKIDVGYNSDLDSFIKKMKREIFGIDQGSYFTWLKPGGSAASEQVIFYQKNYKALMSSYKAGGVPLTEGWSESCFNEKYSNAALKNLVFIDTEDMNSDCKIDKPTPKEILNEFAELVKFFELRKEDLEITAALGSQSIFGSKLIDKVGINRLKSHQWRYFDNLYFENFATVSYNTTSGTPVVLDSTPYGSEINKFMVEVEASLKEKNHIIFHPEVLQYLRDEVRINHFRRVEQIFKIEDAVFEIEKEQDLPDLAIEIAITPQNKEVLSNIETFYPGSPYSGLLRILRSENTNGENEYLYRGTGPYRIFWSNYEDFYTKQSDCFLIPKEGDFDADYFPEIVKSQSSCLTKADQFIERLVDKERGFDDLIKNL